ncbi:MAG: hypothetical protein JWO30_1418 [Fibrobacteres bacterium]|nr:hypothetical protein [Fibrobacterota bacterium]
MAGKTKSKPGRLPTEADGTGKARALIKSLGLQLHPEGGHFREVHRSVETVQTGKGRRSALTTIYFLLRRGEKSVFHRVLSDEVWHFYEGAPLKLLRVGADFKSQETVVLGPTAKGSVQVKVIPRRDWQAAETTGDYTLVGCSVGPGFDFADFRMMREDARAAARLRKTFPSLIDFI